MVDPERGAALSRLARFFCSTVFWRNEVCDGGALVGVGGTGEMNECGEGAYWG